MPKVRANVGIFPYNPTVTGTHVKIGLLALCLAVLVGAPAAWLARHGLPEQASTDIAVEHVAPVTIKIARLASSGTNVLEIGVTGTGAVALYVPASWSRQEVRGASLDSVVALPEDAGFVRWSMPVGATIRFDAVNPGRITIHNPSAIPMTVSATTVNPRTGARESDARIVTTDPYPLP